jgi:CheY-like chemotaxis protein
MRSNPLVLLVTAEAGTFDVIRSAVRESGFRCEARRADDVPTALARLAGGGVRLVVLDTSGGGDNAAGLEKVRKFRASAPEAPLMVWSDSEDSSLPAIASEAGANGCVTKTTSPQELARLLASVLEIREPAAPGADEGFGVPARATVIAVMGVKGGVGATTVAMNVAAALTGCGSVILAEIRPTFGSLRSYFNTGRMIRGLRNRRDGDMAGPANVAMTSLLWPVPTVAGLRLLFGPQTSED